MRRLVPYLFAAAVFAVAVAVGPGFAGAQSDPPAETCVPMPSCLPLNPDGTVSGTEQAGPPLPCARLVGFEDDAGCPPDPSVYDTWLDGPIVQISDALDYAAIGWSSCVINNSAIFTFDFYDSLGIDPAKANTKGKAHAALAPNPPDPATHFCLARLDVTSHHGTTYYKHYGKHPLGPGLGNSVGGNYGHKYDHEWHLVHCGGYQDNNCPAGNLWLTNKGGTRVFAKVYCSNGRGFCPGWAYDQVHIGRPYCDVATVSGVRDECYYVY